MPRTIGIYAGSFDPITYGHMSVIDKAVTLFDKLYIAVGVNPAKKPMFSALDRVHLIRESVEEASAFNTRHADINVISFDNRYLVHVAMDLGCTHIVRGIRNAVDFDYEYSQAWHNSHIAMHYDEGKVSNIETVFLPASDSSVHVSSSAVKGLVGLDGWEPIVNDLVPDPVFKAIQNVYSKAV